jgi:putative transposase
MSRSRYRIWEKAQPHFLTCTVVAWLPVFTRSETVLIVLNSWRFLQEHERMKLYGYVILENHLHLNASATDLSKQMKEFKSFTARRIIDLLEEYGAKALLDQLELYKAGIKSRAATNSGKRGVTLS